MKKSNRQLLTVGLIGAGALGVVALTRPQWLSSIGLSKRQVPLAVTRGASDTVRVIIEGIPRERYLLTATTAGGISQPMEIAKNKPYILGPYGTLSFDLQVPAPTTAHVVVVEMKTGRKMVQDVFVDPTKVQNQLYFSFIIEQGRMK